MKEVLALLMLLVVTASGSPPQFGHASYSSQKFVRDEYGKYHPVASGQGGRPFGNSHPGVGRPPHAASSLIHGQSGLHQFPSHQQGFPSHQNQFQPGFPSHQGQFPSQFPPQTGFGGDVPFIPPPTNPNRPSVIPGVNTQVVPGGDSQVGSDIDLAQFARKKPAA